MRTKTKLLRTLALAALGLAAGLQPAQAQLTIPSDGSDGAFNPPASPTNVVIDLSQAVTGVWNANNTANAGKGIYDPEKWAVVFKYSSVNIPAGVTVSFINHPTHAPVVWLVQGSVTNNGIVRLDGASGSIAVLALTPTEAGPGGFRGGPNGPQGRGDGLGPGGGIGNYASGKYSSSYGNPQAIPLIGGSSGSAWDNNYGSGGAGGGAILIAASGILANEGTISAKGGAGFNLSIYGQGSGGAVRLIASQISGSGEINCLPHYPSNGGDPGRIRIESPVLSSALRTYPETIAVPPATPPLIWPPAGAPTVRVVSVATIAAPADPTAPLVSSADVAIQNDSPSVIMLETQNFPIEGVVQVRAAQKWGSASWINASYVSGNQASAQWRATNTFVKGYTTLQARATAP